MRCPRTALKFSPSSSHGPNIHRCLADGGWFPKCECGDQSKTHTGHTHSQQLRAFQPFWAFRTRCLEWLVALGFVLLQSP